MAKLANNPLVMLAVVFCLILLLELLFDKKVHVVPALFGAVGAALASAASMAGTRYRAGRRGRR